MAIAVLGGLTLSTLLSLLVVPSFYVVADRNQRANRASFRQISAIRARALPHPRPRKENLNQNAPVLDVLCSWIRGKRRARAAGERNRRSGWARRFRRRLPCRVPRSVCEHGAFATYRVEDQRQALQLMVLMRRARRNRRLPPWSKPDGAGRLLLTTPVAAHGEPSDHALFGTRHVACYGPTPSASGVQSRD